MIPKNITREHVIKAIEEIETSGFPAARTSRKFLLKYNGKDYPPKYVLSIANKYANGKKLTPKKKASGSGLGYCDLVSSIKKLAGT